MLQIKLDQGQKVTIITQEMIDQMTDQEYLEHLGMTAEQFEEWMNVLESDNLI